VDREPEHEGQCEGGRDHRQRRPAERSRRDPGDEGPQHQELAVRDVEDAHQAVLEIQSQRDERVDAAGDDPGGDQFEPGAE
jgi:hypothetical protein